MTWFLVGLFVGAPLGFLVFALMAAASNADDELERMYQDRK